MAAQSGRMELGLEEFSSPIAIKAAIAEFIATAIFVFVGVGSIAAFILSFGGGGVIGIALAHGFAIALLAASIGPISGGAINPAVTFALVITNRITISRGAMYVVAQLLGAVLGAFLLKALLSNELLDLIPGAGGHSLAKAVVPDLPGNVKPVSELTGMGVEAVLTFVLVWTVFATAVSPKGNPAIAPLYIGIAITVIHLVAVPITGAGVNPARTFGPAVAGVGGAGDTGVWDDHWVYWVGPLIGAAVAGLLFYVLYLMEDENAATAAAPAPSTSL